MENKELLFGTVCSDVFVWGNPHTDRLVLEKQKLSKLEMKSDVLHFFSQPEGTGGCCEPTLKRSKIMLEILEELVDRKLLKEIVVYIHPREDDSWYLSKGYKPKRIDNFLESMSSEYIASVKNRI